MLGVVLVIASVLIGAKLIANARHTIKEVAVTRSLAAGTTLRADDVALVDVQLPGSGDGAYVGDESDAVGMVLSRPLGKGELVPAAALGVPRPRTTVSVPFAADAAPRLARGQRIVVWLSTVSCPSLVLLPDVTVQDVRTGGDGTFSSAGAGQDVVLSVEAILADRVVRALALSDATIRAGVLTGTPPVADSGELAALDTCGSPAPSRSP